MSIFSPLRRMFGAATPGDSNQPHRHRLNSAKSLLGTVIESEAKRHAANTCCLIIEDRESVIDSDPNLSKLRKLHKLQRLTLTRGQTGDGKCAVRIMREPDLLVGILTGPDAEGVCEALRSCGQAWGRVLDSGKTGAGTFRVDLILFWCNGPLAKPETPPQERAA